MSARKLTVTRVWVIKEGTGAKGPWTLYGVEANDHDGHAITPELKSFSKLPLAEVTVDVEVQDHEKYGRSYLLKPVGGSGRGGAPGGGRKEMAELRARIERLESRVEQLGSGGEAAVGSSMTSAGIPDIPF